MKPAGPRTRSSRYFDVASDPNNYFNSTFRGPPAPPAHENDYTDAQQVLPDVAESLDHDAVVSGMQQLNLSGSNHRNQRFGGGSAGNRGNPAPAWDRPAQSSTESGGRAGANNAWAARAGGHGGRQDGGNEGWGDAAAQ